MNNLLYGATKAALDRIVLAAAHGLGFQGVLADVINSGLVDTGWMTSEFWTRLTFMKSAGR
ncbi:hypothetical protein [Mycobacterium lepromatosis]|uniref:hypothetical protein n=1 Tax=Mycobacterium lepromatosis TaxID=480418 RepID=UPI0006793EA8|nr:hypothetical protein [Mycobacterium lepromatosis]UKN41473.1 hypothetical protein MLPF_0097 [Mycobacterium lepromatosis]